MLKDGLLQLIIDSFPGLMAYVDKNERYLYANSEYGEWFDYNIVGKTIKEVLGEYYQSRKMAIDIVLGGQKTTFEAPLHHKDKGVIFTETTYTPHFNDEGEVEGFVAIVVDVTNERRSDIYSLLMHAPMSVVLLKGESLNVELINSIAMKSIDNRDITGLNLEEAVPAIQNTEVIQKIREVYSSGKPQHVSQWPVVWKNNDDSSELRYFDLIYHPWIDFYGKVIGVLHMGIDVTERIQAQKRSEESEIKFKMYSESMPQMAFIADASGSITYFNQRWFEYTGFNSDESYGWSWQPVHHPDDLARAIDTWTHSIQTGETYQIEYRLRRFDGAYRWHLGRAVPLRNDKSEIIGWLGTNTDIHDQKITEAHLENALKTRDEFLSIASHELKTPITSLKLQSQLIVRAISKGDEHLLTSEKIKDYAEQTDETVNRLSRLINDMMDVSRISAGKLMLDRIQTNLGTLVIDTVHQMENQFNELHIPLPKVQIENEVTGEWDHYRIQQVLTNLLTNGIRYGNGGALQIRVWKKQTSAYFSVTDHGIGIDAKDVKRIFGRFERGVEASEVSGMGLGLYITQQLVEAHHGHISVTSELGKGSTFQVELPL